MFLSRRTFLQRSALAAGIGFGSTLYAKPTAWSLPRSRPEDHAVSSSGVADFLAAVDAAEMELHSLMILRHGQVVVEGWWQPYGPDFVHSLYSLSKSFTSTAVGFAVQEGKMSVDDLVTSFFPDELPAKVSENLAAMRLRHLLTMSTGNAKEPTQICTQSENWVRTFLAQPFAHQPGTQFMYNSAATYMCSAIVQKVTGQSLLDYLEPRLFQPLGISEKSWESCPRGISTGGWGLSLTTESLAKMGQFLLQKGKWQGTQLLSSSWIDEATRFHIQQPGGDKKDRPQAQNDWLQGYGYQFWRCQGGRNFRGDGAFGQFIVVCPDQEAVIVMTSENKNMQGQLDLVWKHLLPAFDSTEPKPVRSLPPAPWRIQPPAGAVSSEHAVNRTYLLSNNEYRFQKLRLQFHSDQVHVYLDDHQIICGLKDWILGESQLPIPQPRLITGGRGKRAGKAKIAAHASWTSADELTCLLRYIETPHHDRFMLKMKGDELTLTFLNSITAMNPKGKDPRAAILGKLSA